MKEIDEIEKWSLWLLLQAHELQSKVEMPETSKLFIEAIFLKTLRMDCLICGASQEN